MVFDLEVADLVVVVELECLDFFLEEMATDLAIAVRERD